MNIIDKKSTLINLIWIFLYILITLSLLMLIFLFIYISGYNIIIVFFTSSLNLYFIFSSLLILFLIIFYARNAIISIKSLRKTVWEKPSSLNRGISFLLASALLIFFILFPIKYTEYVNGKEPSAVNKFRYKAGPFIQFGPFKNNQAAFTSGSLVIWWFDPVQANKSAIIKYGKTPVKKEMHIINEIPGSKGKRHEVRLNNLDPGTTYFYYVPGFDENIYSFTTESNDNDSSAFHFLSIGDACNHGGYKHSYNGEISRLAYDFYNGQDYKPAFVLYLGDIAHKGSDLQSWEMFFLTGKLLSSRYPCMTAFGNHENYEDYGGNFNYFFNRPRYYSFNYKNVHILSIHNFDGFMKTTSGKQYNFIKNDLAEYKNKKWIIVIMHVPPISTGDFNMNELLIGQYTELFRKNRVDLVLCGHDHHYDSFWIDKDSAWGGTFYIVNGGGGSRADHYIMTRNYKKWKTWFHDRSSEYGLYLKDKLTEKYHIYGEISWGFLDVEVKKNSLTLSYYRWLDINTFLEITGQELKSWQMFPFDQETWEKNKLSEIKLVHTLTKKRKFY